MEKCRLQIWESMGTRYLDGNRWIEKCDWITLAIGPEDALRQEVEIESWAFQGYRWRIISEENYLKGY